jgi:hypothetical protein
MTQWFTDNSPEDSVPLGKDYLQSGGSPLDTCTVSEIVLNSTGALLIGTKFKGILFKNKVPYKLLTEAIEYFILDPSVSCQITIRVKETGYIDAGSELDSIGCGQWFKDGNRYYFRSNSASTVPVGNPFIPTRPEMPSESGRATRAKGK